MKKLILGTAAASLCALAPLPIFSQAAFADPGEDWVQFHERCSAKKCLSSGDERCRGDGKRSCPGSGAKSSQTETKQSNHTLPKLRPPTISQRPFNRPPYTNPLFSGDFADAVNAYGGRHYTRALAMFQKLGQNNDGPALYWLSNMHRSGYKVQKSKALSETYLNRALPIIRQSANEDDPRALYYLSEMYDIGRGVKASRKKSLRNLKRSTELGYTEAYLKMAKQYRLGKGVKKDTAKALAYKNKAADQGYVEAMYELAENYSIDYKTYNISKDLQKTRQYYQRAANNGHLVSMQRLGFMHLRGDGGERSPIEAKAWFVKARDGGYEYNPGAVSTAEQAIEENKEYALRQELSRLSKEKAANAIEKRPNCHQEN